MCTTVTPIGPPTTSYLSIPQIRRRLRGVYGLAGGDYPAFESTPLNGTVDGTPLSLHQIFIGGWGRSIIEFLDSKRYLRIACSGTVDVLPDHADAECCQWSSFACKCFSPALARASGTSLHERSYTRRAGVGRATSLYRKIRVCDRDRTGKTDICKVCARIHSARCPNDP